MTRIKDPKQVANTIRHILLILISSLRVCFMAGRRGWRRLLALWGGMKGRFVGGSGGSGGTDEDCPPVNELNASNKERTTAGLKEGGSEGRDERIGGTSPRSEENESVHVCF